MNLNHVFANRSDNEEIYSLTVSEIAEEQTKDKGLQQQRSVVPYSPHSVYDLQTK